MISVVITCHNLERYIGAAIESVLAQSYAGEMQILVIDDCSSDGSAAVIRGYPGVLYLRSPSNVGVLLATVIGIEQSRGEHLFFLDGDDVWEADKVARVMAAFAADPACTLVTHDLAYVDRDGQAIGQVSRPAQVLAGLSAPVAGEWVRNGILQHGDYVWLGSAYAVHRQRADLAGFCRFARELQDPFNTYQDWPLAYWAVAQPGSTAAYVPEILFRYRLHGANHSGDASHPDKARRNYRRTLNTLLAIQAIGRKFVIAPAAMHATERKLRFAQYLDDLYNGRRRAAFGGFLASRSYLMRFPARELCKEIVRFAAISTLGLGGFVAVQNCLGRVWRRGR